MASTHTQTYTQTDPRTSQGGWSTVKGSDAILTHVGLALPLIKLVGFEQREDAAGVGEQAMAKTCTHVYTHCFS